MAIQKTWGFGTNTRASADVTPSSINPVSDFALVQDEPTDCKMSQQSAIDNRELLTYSCKDIGPVQTFLKPVHPSHIKSSVSYVIRLDEQLKLTSTEDPTYEETLPIVMNLSIRHPKSGQITPEDIQTLFERLIGACYKTKNGVVTTRFGDLMQSALRPTSDGIAAQ